VAVLYNLLVIVARSVFWQLRERGMIAWFVLDYTCDFVYLVDMFVQLRTGLLCICSYNDLHVKMCARVSTNLVFDRLYCFKGMWRI